MTCQFSYKKKTEPGNFIYSRYEDNLFSTISNQAPLKTPPAHRGAHVGSSHVKNVTFYSFNSNNFSHGRKGNSNYDLGFGFDQALGFIEFPANSPDQENP